MLTLCCKGCSVGVKGDATVIRLKPFYTAQHAFTIHTMDSYYNIIMCFSPITLRYFHYNGAF